jgi:hypothetical protein
LPFKFNNLHRYNEAPDVDYKDLNHSSTVASRKTLKKNSEHVVRPYSAR